MANVPAEIREISRLREVFRRDKTRYRYFRKEAGNFLSANSSIGAVRRLFSLERDFQFL